MADQKTVPPHKHPLLVLIHRIEDLLLATMLTTTMGLALLQILLRNFAGSGFVWGDALIRVLVLWLGMAGAMIATRQQKHININLLTRYLPESAQTVVQQIVTFFAALVCATGCYYSYKFVLSEFEVGEPAFGQIPAWLCEAILPLGFGIIALRYLLQSLTGFRRQEKARP